MRNNAASAPVHKKKTRPCGRTVRCFPPHRRAVSCRLLERQSIVPRRSSNIRTQPLPQGLACRSTWRVVETRPRGPVPPQMGHPEGLVGQLDEDLRVKRLAQVVSAPGGVTPPDDIGNLGPREEHLRDMKKKPRTRASQKSRGGMGGGGRFGGSVALTYAALYPMARGSGSTWAVPEWWQLSMNPNQRLTISPRTEA